MKYTNLFIGLIFFSFISFTNCQNNKDINKLSSFFRTVNWQDFNKNTLKRNKLSHFLKDSIDFYERESFFAFMANSNEHIPYQEFYIIEINQTGERNVNKKILAIKNGKNIDYFGYERGISWSIYQITDEERNKFRYDILKNGIQLTNQSYLMITNIIGLKY